MNMSRLYSAIQNKYYIGNSNNGFQMWVYPQMGYSRAILEGSVYSRRLPDTWIWISINCMGPWNMYLKPIPQIYMFRQLCETWWWTQYMNTCFLMSIQSVTAKRRFYFSDFLLTAKVNGLGPRVSYHWFLCSI